MSSDIEKEKISKQFSKVLENSKMFAKELQTFDRKFFDFRIAFNGFLGIILTIVFSNKEDFPCYFLFVIVTIFIFSFTVLLYEIWCEGKNKMKNLNSSERTLILYNILNSAVQNNMSSYIVQVTNSLKQEHKIRQAMEENKSIEEIVGMIGQKRKWGWSIFVWGFLSLSVPFLFFIELL